jgi:hypothetical protein
MALNLTQTRVSSSEKQEIVNKSPEAVLPLNPSAQGWTGQAIKRQLSIYVTDEQASVLALVANKFDNVSDALGALETLVNSKNSGVHYDDDLPPENLRYNNLTYFDEE